jgi:putative membrane protein
MKKLVVPLMLLFAVACGDSDNKDKDSVEMAKEENQARDTAHSPAPGELSDDNNFLVEAASGSMMEIQLGQYATTNAASAAVKQFGQMMVTDHTRSDSVLTTIAQVKSIAIPNVPGDMHQHHIDEMKRKKGTGFDKDYMKMMIEDHEEDIKKFEDAAKNAKDEDIRQFAVNTLPVLKKHLDAAKKIKSGLR